MLATGSGIDITQDFGQHLHESFIKARLRKLAAGFHFDVGGNLNIAHPNQWRWQGVWFNGHHIYSMERGYMPEFTVYGMKPAWNLELNKMEMKPGIVLAIGWRELIEAIAKRHIPGVTTESLCKALGVVVKHRQEVAPVVWKG